jgi:hypothetical protein
MDIKPTNKSETFGRGIIPDVTINYSINDLVNKKDPQMEWIEKDIKNKD